MTYTLGHSVSDATREKIAASKRGIPRSEETRKKLSIANTGKKQSEETRRKISNSLRGEKSPFFGKPKSEETKKKLHLANLGRSPPNKGVQLSEEQRKYLSEIQRGKVLSESHRRNISIGITGVKNPFFGKTHTEEARRKISESKQNLSSEARRNMSIAHIGLYSGENHPNWKGGISFEPYCPKFTKRFKERVRAFFGYRCLECGTPQLTEKLHVHHVTFNKKTCCDKTKPLFVPLCRSCHGKTSSRRKYWIKHFTDIINLYYSGKCYLSEEEMKQLEIGV